MHNYFGFTLHVNVLARTESEASLLTHLVDEEYANISDSL